MPRNAVVVTIDALRWDHVTAYSSGSPAATDAFERFAAGDATVLESFWSGGCVTGRSFRTVFSGRPDFSRGRRNLSYPRELPSLPSFLPEDVTTIAVSSNATVRTEGGWHAGWDRFEDFSTGSAGPGGEGFGFDAVRRRLGDVVDAAPSVVGERVQTAYRYHNLRSGALPFPDGRRVSERATSLLGEAEEPFLLWVHFMEPHTPWLPIETSGEYSPYRVARVHGRMERDQRRLDGTERECLRKLYARRVETVDDVVGDLLSTLDGAVSSDETLLWLFADHGEELGEDGWFGHGHMGAPRRLVPSLTHVPGLIRAPGEDVDADRTCGHVDVAPTLCDWFGGTEPGRVEGTSLFGELPEDRPVWSFCDDHPDRDRQTVACVTDRWRFVRVETGSDVSRQLYDRERGSATNDVFDGYSDIGEQFDRRAVERTGASGGDDEAASDDRHQRLRDLGYR